MRRLNELGQTTVELIASLSTVVLTITAAGWLMKVEWDRGKCAYIVFEKTHAQATHSLPPLFTWGSDMPVQVQNVPGGTEGTGICGQSAERVSLPQLDPEAKQEDPL